jgi:hypothetical protein
MSLSRRHFLHQAAAVAATAAIAPQVLANELATQPFFEISLAEWSLHKALFSKKIDNLDFPAIAKKQYGISVVEYVNQFFKDKAQDTKYLSDLLQRCRDNGVRNHLIMIDGEGELGAPGRAPKSGRKPLQMGRCGQVPGLPHRASQCLRQRLGGRRAAGRYRRPEPPE